MTVNKLIAALICAAIVVPGSARQKKAEKAGFDENHVVLSLGVLSDTHVDGVLTVPGYKFRMALLQLRDKAAQTDVDGLDGVLIAGDLINNPFHDPKHYAQMNSFRAIYESVLDPARIPLVFTPGNHDIYKEWTENTVKDVHNLYSRLGDGFFLSDLDKGARDTLGCRHCKIGDYHVLCIVPSSSRPTIQYPAAALEWLDATLKELTSAEPDRYVILLTHPMLDSTVYGSTLGAYWETSALDSLMNRYPQVITFSGHLHFPLNDPRSIWQGGFTAVGCGSVRYMAIENGGYEDMSSATVMKDANEFSQGLLLQFDRRGNARLVRMDFYNARPIGEDWTLSKPAADGSHLKKYTTAGRAAANSAPELCSLEVVPDGDKVSVAFASGKDDEFVHHYVLTLTGADGVSVTKKVLADFYRHPLPSGMKPSWEVPFTGLQPGKYTVSLTAFDSWGAESNTLIKEFTL